MAFDQSTTCTGWSLWKNEKLNKYGLLESDKKEKDSVQRMRQMHFMIKELILKNNIDYVVLEDVHFKSNYRTYAQLSQLQGVIFSILFELNINFRIVAATTWKKFCKIQGKKRDEQKISTIQMVKETFGVNVSEDIADAIGIGCLAINLDDLKEG